MNNGKNFKINKTVMNFLHAKDFYKPGDAEDYRTAASSAKFEAARYGFEIPNFNMVDPELDMVFSEILGEHIEMDNKHSGIFRYPYRGIHFDDFNSLFEWRFFVALEDNQFTTYSHKSGAKDARDGINFDYKNSIDWNIESVINIKQNDCLFYRPWVFHSYEPKMISFYKLLVLEE